MLLCMHVYMHSCMYVNMFLCMCVCVYVSVYVSVCVFVSTSNRPVLVVTTNMSELLSSSATVRSSSVGVDGLNRKGVLAPLMSPVWVT